MALKGENKLCSLLNVEPIVTILYSPFLIILGVGGLSLFFIKTTFIFNEEHKS